MLQRETTITTIHNNDDINNNQKTVFSTTRCQLDVPARRSPGATSFDTEYQFMNML